MSEIQVLLVAGTHGNEINPIWLFEQWEKLAVLINTYGIATHKVIGNPKAYKSGKRYIHNDLNRSFTKELFEKNIHSNLEKTRAADLLQIYGENGENPCHIALDFHTTTASMGSCLVVYGRRASDLALASLVQSKLGLPIYLHESDHTQTGFLVESWKCGLVLEIGPVAQGLFDSRIISQTKLVLESCLEQIKLVENNDVFFPDKLIVHRHIKSIDFPRDSKGFINGYVHPLLQSKDWYPLNINDELFLMPDGENIKFDEKEKFIPVFINEAAYMEKNIAMSLTKREVWEFKSEWKKALFDLVQK